MFKVLRKEEWIPLFSFTFSSILPSISSILLKFVKKILKSSVVDFFFWRRKNNVGFFI